MKIVVCIKQVPGTSKVDIDEETGVLKRVGVEAKMNPYDLYALETSFRLREMAGGTVTVVSMGPPQAAAVIIEAYAMGADKGFLISDKAFAGADVLATSEALSQGIILLDGFDIIICGKQTTDGDTAQVGPEIAEKLDLPHAVNIMKINGVSPSSVNVTADLGDYYETLELTTPCLITVDKGIYEPRLPSYKRGLQTKDREITMLALKDFPNPDPSRFGLNGSPTRVERVYPPESRSDREIYEGGADAADRLLDKLTELKII